MSDGTVEIKGCGMADWCLGLADSVWGEPCSCSNPCWIQNTAVICFIPFLIVFKILETCGALCGINCCNPTKEVPEGSNLIKADKSNVVVVPVAGAPSDLEMGR